MGFWVLGKVQGDIMVRTILRIKCLIKVNDGRGIRGFEGEPKSAKTEEKGKML